MTHHGHEVFQALDGDDSFARRLFQALGCHHDSVHQEIDALKQMMETLMGTYADLVAALQADEVVLDGVSAVLAKNTIVMTGILSQLEALKAAPSAAQIDATIAEVKGHLDALSTASGLASTAADAVTAAETPAPGPAPAPAAPAPDAPAPATPPATPAA